MYARVLLIIFCGQFSFPLNSIRSIIFTLGPLSPRGRHINTSTSTWPKYTISPTHCDIPTCTFVLGSDKYVQKNEFSRVGDRLFIGPLLGGLSRLGKSLSEMCASILFDRIC